MAKSSIVIKAKGNDIAAITSDQRQAAWLLEHVGKATPKPGGKLLIFNKSSRNGARVDVETAAFLLGLSVNGSKPGGKSVVWKNHTLWFVAGEEQVVICDTRVPAPKSMVPFLLVAAKFAGVDEADMVRMFPENWWPVVPISVETNDAPVDTPIATDPAK